MVICKDFSRFFRDYVEIGDLELDQTLTSRDVVNTKMRSILDEATDPWGIKVNRVELKNILPPADIQNSMEKQMKAERDRRHSACRSPVLQTSIADRRCRFHTRRLRSVLPTYMI